MFRVLSFIFALSVAVFDVFRILSMKDEDGNGGAMLVFGSQTKRDYFGSKMYTRTFLRLSRALHTTRPLRR